MINYIYIALVAILMTGCAGKTKIVIDTPNEQSKCNTDGSKLFVSDHLLDKTYQWKESCKNKMFVCTYQVSTGTKCKKL